MSELPEWIEKENVCQTPEMQRIAGSFLLAGAQAAAKEIDGMAVINGTRLEIPVWRWQKLLKDLGVEQRP
jgi:hypothetical protein